MGQIVTEAATTSIRRLTDQLGKWEKDLSDLSEELSRTKSELETARENETKCKHEATTKIASLEQELANQGEILRVVVQKLITTQGFTKLMSSVSQATNCMVRSKTLEQVHESFDVPTRRKDWGWHPQATSVAKKAYALKVLTEPPKFALVDYICEQPRALTLEEVQKMSTSIPPLQLTQRK